MKNLLLLVSGAGLGILAYAVLNQNNTASPLSRQPGAWGTDQRIGGAGNSIKGGVKKGLGKLTGDDATQASGLVDKAKGAVGDAVGATAQKISDVTRNA